MRAYHPGERAVYETLYHRAAVREQEDALREEELRVLYVALTRAREELTVVGTTKDLQRTPKIGRTRTRARRKAILGSSCARPRNFRKPGESLKKPGSSFPARLPHEGAWAFHLHEAGTLHRQEAAAEDQERFCAWAGRRKA